MNLSSHVLTLSAYAVVAPGDAVVPTDETYRVGLSQLALGSLMPADANVIYTRQFTIPTAGVDYNVNMKTMQITTIDATAPKDPDGNAIVFTKIYLAMLRLVSAVTTAGPAALRLRPLGSGTSLAQNIDLNPKGVGGIGIVFSPDGITIDATNNTCVLTENGTGGLATSVVGQLICVGKV